MFYVVVVVVAVAVAVVVAAAAAVRGTCKTTRFESSKCEDLLPGQMGT